MHYFGYGTLEYLDCERLFFLPWSHAWRAKTKIIQINGKKKLCWKGFCRRSLWLRCLPLIDYHTCSRSTVTQQKSKRLLAVFLLMVCVLLWNPRNRDVVFVRPGDADGGFNFKTCSFFWLSKVLKQVYTLTALHHGFHSFGPLEWISTWR